MLPYFTGDCVRFISGKHCYKKLRFLHWFQIQKQNCKKNTKLFANNCPFASFSYLSAFSQFRLEIKIKCWAFWYPFWSIFTL